MLLLRETRVVKTNHEAVATGVILREEGIALVYTKEDGATKVQPSTGTAGEIFAGVNLSRNAPPSVLPMVNVGNIGADGSFELGRAPLAGALLVKVGADAAGMGGTKFTVVTGTPIAGEVKISGTTLQFLTTQAGKAIFAQFMYHPSVVEATAILGNLPTAGVPLADTVGVLKEAQIGTSFFDASADWSNALYVKLAAGGTLTVGTEADHVNNVVVKNAPNASSPFLVVNINIA